jgi:chromosome segregation ATPase
LNPAELRRQIPDSELRVISMKKDLCKESVRVCACYYKRLEQHCDKLQARVQQLEETVTECVRLNQDVADLLVENNALDVELDEYGNKLAALQRENKQLETRNAELEADLTEVGSWFQQMQQRVRELSRENELLKREAAVREPEPSVEMS